MGMAMDMLLNAVKSSINQHAGDQSHTGFDPTQLLGHIDQIFQQHQNGQLGGSGNVQPASRDPYGDPGAGRYGNVKPASQDPYGDPADERH